MCCVILCGTANTHTIHSYLVCVLITFQQLRNRIAGQGPEPARLRQEYAISPAAPMQFLQALAGAFWDRLRQRRMA